MIKLKKHWILNLAETNLVNLTILISLIVYFGKQFLTTTLQSRQQRVITALQEAEDKLQKASARLSESEKQLAQTQLVIEQVTEEASKTAQKVKDLIMIQGKLEVERLTKSSQDNIKNAEFQIRKKIQQQISTLAIERVTLDLKNKMTDSIQSQIIDDNIAKLGGSL
uniref:ATP synthase CFO B subunit subunit I n=1 Tax=Rhodella violacea TaxID=2801 RepID=UPI001FCCF6C6|nr:ATP synthase CFO B subunit subunit I [Rhodella violacea]UNJ18138.1 ATP synthase CFO B subunit subunit I [Rhodella violacea]